MIYRISSRQVFFTFFIIVSLSLGLSNILVKDLGQDFWQATALALIIEVMLGWFLYKIGLKYPKQTIFQYSEIILGKFLGRLSAGVFSIFFIGVATTLTMSIVDFFGSIIMPETPKYVFVFLLLLVSTYAVCSGIEVIMRLAELFGPFILGSYLFITVFNIPKMDIQNLRPIFQHSISEVARGTVLPAAWFGICIIMGLLMAYHNSPKDMYKVKLIGVGLGVISFTVLTFIVIMVIGVEISSEQKFSIFVLARMVVIGDFIERLEAFQLAAWTGGVFFIIALFQYAGVEGLRHIFPKKSKLFLGIGISALIFILTIFVYPSSHDKALFFREKFGYFGLAIELGGVGTLYLIHVLKQKFKKG